MAGRRSLLGAVKIFSMARPCSFLGAVQNKGEPPQHGPQWG